MIETRNLGKRFGSRVAVDDLSFQVATGEVLGFLGPNGAGKSTTMKMLTGFLAPSAGTASIFGFDIRSRTLQAQRLIGYLPEGSPCYAEMTVQGFLDFIAEIRGYRGAGKRERVPGHWGCWNWTRCAGRPSKPSPRASAGVSAWPRRSSTNRGRWCSTSPPTGSIRTRSTRSAS